VEGKTERKGGETRFVLVFSDQGQPFNPLEKAEPDLGLSPEERPVGGLGLVIVKRTMDTMNYSYRSGVNRLEIAKVWGAVEGS
jgi:anti-sigma regulatory factor (Ser/Thr protein kinase)